MYVLSCSAMSNSMWSHGLQPSRLLSPWNFPGKDTWVGCHFLLQGIFLTQGLSSCLLHWQADSLPLSHLGSPLDMDGWALFCQFEQKFPGLCLFFLSLFFFFFFATSHESVIFQNKKLKKFPKDILLYTSLPKDLGQWCALSSRSLMKTGMGVGVVKCPWMNTEAVHVNGI